MEKEFIRQWDANKHKLEEYFKNTPLEEYRNYEDIVAKIFELCITSTAKAYNNGGFNSGNMTVIDDGDYQGTQIFIIPVDTYQPSVSDYVMTHNYYGSCSGCDTLMGIHEYENGLPSDKQVKEYMTLALHLVQRLKWLVDNEEQEWL